MTGKEGFTSMPSVAGKDAQFKPPKIKPGEGPGQWAELSLLWKALIAVSLVAAIASLALAAYSTVTLMSFKGEVRQIAQDLKTMQGKAMVTFSTPVAANITLQKTIPLARLFPGEYTIPIDTQLRLKKRITAVSSSGTPIFFDLDETIPVKGSIPLNGDAVNAYSLTINEKVPVNQNITMVVTISDAYPQEYTDMIKRLEALGG